MDEHSNIVIVKSRQLGTTQCVISKFLHRACLNQAYTSMAFMRNQEDTSALSRRVKQMLSGLQNYVTAENDNINHLKLRERGEIYFKNSSAEGSRSYDSVSDFLYDESAFQQNIDKIFAASNPSTAMSNNVTKVIVSTPLAKSGWYWDRLSENNFDLDVEQILNEVAAGNLYNENLPGLYYWVDSNNCCKLVLHFSCHPLYSKIDREQGGYLAYRKREDATDDATIQREYNLKFVDASVSVFSATLVHSCAVGTWEESRNPKAKYYSGLDCATTGNDYVVFSIIKELADKYSLIALYRQRKQSNEYHLYHISEIIKKYKPESIGVETTGGVGQIYLEQLSQKFSHINIVGIATTSQSKPAMISRLILAMERQILDFPDNPMITGEFLNFIRQGNQLQAASGKNDDIIMSLAFTLTVTPLTEIPENNNAFGKNASTIFDSIPRKAI